MSDLEKVAEAIGHDDWCHAGAKCGCGKECTPEWSECDVWDRARAVLEVLK